MLPAGIQRDVPLAPMTTLGIGGPAKYLLSTQRLGEVRAALLWARKQQVPTFVLGGGSNILVADAGFCGLVVQYRNQRITLSAPLATQGGRPCRLLVAGAGVAWEQVVRAAVEHGCGGIECLAGIPGTMGAAPVQNIGAYGQELAQSLLAVHAMDRATGDVHTFKADACGMGYRTSHFKLAWRDQYLIVRVDLALAPGAAGALGYGELRAFFEHASAAPSISEVASAVLRLRQRKSMVLSDPSDPNCRSVGSFFMNPVVDATQAAQLAAVHGADMPTYPAAQGRKLSAAWLIERAGFGRGYVLGSAGVSSRHALAIINRGAATAVDILALASAIRHGVHARFGVSLTPEAQLVGFSQSEIYAMSAPM